MAQLLILGILPQGYIYPKEDRPVRDLARKRMFLVKHKTAHILSLQSLIARCCGQRISTNQIRTLTVADLRQLLSDGKSKGSGNRKNGNRYLGWAFVEAAQLGRRYSQRFCRYYDRKAAQTNTIVATKALSNKLARICYYIMRDQVPFKEEMF